jgi:hypothetical protein
MEANIRSLYKSGRLDIGRMGGGGWASPWTMDYNLGAVWGLACLSASETEVRLMTVQRKLSTIYVYVLKGIAVLNEFSFHI